MRHSVEVIIAGSSPVSIAIPQVRKEARVTKYALVVFNG